MFGTIWDYEYSVELENGKIENKKLHLVYNLRALKIYYNFFGSDMIGDFYKFAYKANAAVKSLPEELRDKFLSGAEIKIEDLSEDEFELVNELLSNNSEFTERATIALIAAGENTKRSADEIMQDLPVMINDDEFRKSLTEFISFCAENAKKKQGRSGLGSRESLRDYTAALIFGACQIGLNVSADDMSPNLIMAVADYAARQTNKENNDDTPAMSMSEMRRMRHVA